MKKETKNVSTLEKDKKVSEEKENENKGKTFGDIIVEGRTKKDLSQEKFAEKMGVSRQMVSRWELNTAMPRMHRIKKISEILDIPIENLMKSKYKTDFTDTVAKNHFNLKAVMKSIAVILIILFVLYFAYVGYKFMVLNGISSKLEQYMNLDNYYFKLEKIVDNELQETREILYKDGYYKIITISKNNDQNFINIKYLDLNKRYMYLANEKDKNYSSFDLMDTEQYKDGKYMYTFFPSIVNKGATDFKEWAFKLNLIFAYYKNKSLLLKINDECIEFNKDSLLPVMQSFVLKQNKNNQRNKFIFDIKINEITESDVTIPSDYVKIN